MLEKLMLERLPLEELMLARALCARPLVRFSGGRRQRSSATTKAGNMIAVSFASSATEYAVTEAASQAIECWNVVSSFLRNFLRDVCSPAGTSASRYFT